MTYRASTPPLSASLGENWVDSSDQDKIYTCIASYDSSQIERTLTVPAPGGVDIAFNTVAPHTPSTIEIVRGGASGSPNASVTGDGTEASPKAYTFVLYDDASSNDHIIALCLALPGLTAENADTTSAPVVAFGPEKMSNTIEADFWSVRAIYCRFVAIPQNIELSDVSLPGHIPASLRNVLPEAIALRLASSDGGGDITRAAVWAGRVELAKRKSRKSMKNQTNTVLSQRSFR